MITRYELSRIGKFTQTESRLELPGAGREREWGPTAQKLEFLFGTMKTFGNRGPWRLHNIVNVVNGTELYALQ